MGKFSFKLFSRRIIVYFVPFCFRLLCFIEVCFGVCVCVCFLSLGPVNACCSLLFLWTLLDFFSCYVFVWLHGLAVLHSTHTHNQSICGKEWTSHELSMGSSNFLSFSLFALSHTNTVHFIVIHIVRSGQAVRALKKIENYGPITNMVVTQ